MNKKLIVVLALAVVLVSGFTLNAQAGCGLTCLGPDTNVQSRDIDRTPPVRDMDRPNANCQGAYNYGPRTPEPMGSTGF